MSNRALTWTAIAAPGQEVPVLDGQISVDATRNPQVSATLRLPFTSWASAKAFDPFTRSQAWIDIRLATFRDITLDEYDPASATLDAFNWTARATTPYGLEVGVTPDTLFHRLALYVVDVNVNETARTMTVELASGDYLATEVVNLGPPWLPAAAAIVDTGRVYLLNRAWDEFFQTFSLPLFDATPSGMSQVGVDNLSPWQTGQSAWSWLDAARTQAGDRYRLDTTTGGVQFFGPVIPSATIDRARSTATVARRSARNPGEGVNQYADVAAIRWTDPTDQDRAEVWDIALGGRDWRQARRPWVEEREMTFQGIGYAVGLAASRQERMRRWKRTTTTTVPLDPTVMPFRDLSNHPFAAAVQTLVYDYPSGDVTTTYFEED